ncbi:apolipoprotein N-acyltransferase [Kribbia dieselivorans]|uniref:apolipoprotein N-acyltransferase n=1 Tax=Kribbia dieselivorans TaxID=331526 RepID=UPI000A5B8AED|nr:apolipoprotein N-acyltransferase [Kribbia dieselivorans]
MTTLSTPLDPASAAAPARTILGQDLPLPGRYALALVGGLCLWLSFPDHNVAALAPVGVALLTAAVLGTRARTALGLGLVGGLAYFTPVLSWSGIFVGKLPWFALATLEALYVAVMCGVIAFIQRPLLAAGRPLVALGAVPLGWVVQELARGTTPFGGFPWARLAFGQADTPLARLAALAGAPGITFGVAVLGVALYWLIVAPGGVLNRRRWVPSLAATGAVALAVVAVPIPTDGSEVPVTLVQGNVPKPGLDFNAERRQVLDNHVEGTILAAAENRSAGVRPDVVIWPENASDIDPFRNGDAAAQVQRAVEAAGAPVLVGAILNEPEPQVSNASLLYRPGGGPVERYTKQHPVPFAEYIPYRDFFRHFSDKVDLVREGGFAAGQAPAAFSLGEGTATPWKAVPTICFEVAYDGLMRDALAEAGGDRSILVVQTNNATFGFSAESTQQFAISRIRAIEHGRAVAHVSTVGVSGFIAPDGSTMSAPTDLFTAAQITDTPVARTGTTISDRLGSLPEILAVIGLIVLVAWSGITRRTVNVVQNAALPDPKDHA